MKKKPNYKPETKIREAIPKLGEQILCPFCIPTHPLAVGKDSACGTTLKVTAVQVVVPARTVHKYNLVCVKCGKSNGEMVKFNQGYIHLRECDPGTILLAETPQFTKWAALVFKLPEPIRKWIEKMTGIAREVRKKETDEVQGYFFYRNTGG